MTRPEQGATPPLRARPILAAVLTALVIGGTVAASKAIPDKPDDTASRMLMDLPRHPNPTASPTPSPTASPTEEVSPTLNLSATVSVESEGFFAWSALDRTTGETAGSENANETSSTESMIKVWLVSDYLRREAERGTEPSESALRDASLAIRDSHNSAAQRLYEAGGQDAVVERMIEICGLTDTYIPDEGHGWWSRTEMSPADAVRLGECVADGTAAGPEWTEWVLSEMQEVRGTTADEDQRPDNDFEGGHWGIIDGLPERVVEQGVSIKNGWTRIGSDNSWHVNCLAVTDNWVIAVMMRYPADYSLDYGAERCALVAHQLFEPASREVPSEMG